MSGPRVPAVDPVALAAQLRVVLGEIDAGRMVATMSTRARIEGRLPTALRRPRLAPGFVMCGPCSTLAALALAGTPDDDRCDGCGQLSPTLTTGATPHRPHRRRVRALRPLRPSRPSRPAPMNTPALAQLPPDHLAAIAAATARLTIADRPRDTWRRSGRPVTPTTQGPR